MQIYLTYMKMYTYNFIVMYINLFNLISSESIIHKSKIGVIAKLLRERIF